MWTAEQGAHTSTLDGGPGGPHPGPPLQPRRLPRPSPRATPGHFGAPIPPPSCHHFDWNCFCRRRDQA